jgi:hypothetical protein
MANQKTFDGMAALSGCQSVTDVPTRKLRIKDYADGSFLFNQRRPEGRKPSGSSQ